MVANNPVDPVAAIAGFRLELHNLLTRHDSLASTFERNSGVGAILVNLGLHWAEDAFDTPTAEARAEASRLRSKWTESKQYHGLVLDFDMVVYRVKEQLSPMFRRSLPFGSVYHATTLVTKIRHLDATLSILDDRARAWIASGRRLPVGVARSNKSRKSGPIKSGFWMPRTLTDWVALVAGIGFLLSLALQAAGSIGHGLAIIAGTSVLLVVLLWSVTILVRRRRRSR